MSTGYRVPTTVRNATEDDLTACSQLDLSYETDYVWQMDVRDEGGAIAIGLRTARLPRLMRVVYPRDSGALEAALKRGDIFIISETSGAVTGYLVMRIDTGHSNGWITDLAVGRAWRRQKMGGALLAEAYRRAQELSLHRLTVEIQSKNYPGICFCQKQGLSFCGFNDRYYPNHDIALFFGQNVRL